MTIAVDLVAELYQRALRVPVEQLTWSALQDCGINLAVRRDDLLDSGIPGNKFYKLVIDLQSARTRGFSRLVSFGGAYSNHLHALAAAGERYGFDTVGIVRGDQPAALSPTLRDAAKAGMQLRFVSRECYRQLADQGTDSPDVIRFIEQEFGRCWIIPEGGASDAGCRGATLIGRALEQQWGEEFQQVCVPCGTGTTLAGIAAGLPAKKNAIGFSVLKGMGNLGAKIAVAYQAMTANQAVSSAGNWRLVSGFHAGGYGKKLPENVRQFWRDFELETGLLLDPVYTLKMFWGILLLAQRGYWRKGTRLVAVHTGGLQGRRGFAAQIDW